MNAALPHCDWFRNGICMTYGGRGLVYPELTELVDDWASEFPPCRSENQEELLNDQRRNRISRTDRRR